MCLAIPGRLASVGEEQLLGRSGIVDFGGVTREVSLAFVPEARVGDWVLVHVGFALNIIAEADAERVLADLRILAGAEAAADAQAEAKAAAEAEGGGTAPPGLTAGDGA